MSCCLPGCLYVWCLSKCLSLGLFDCLFWAVCRHSQWNHFSTAGDECTYIYIFDFRTFWGFSMFEEDCFEIYIFSAHNIFFFSFGCCVLRKNIFVFTLAFSVLLFASNKTKVKKISIQYNIEIQQQKWGLKKNHKIFLKIEMMFFEEDKK